MDMRVGCCDIESWSTTAGVMLVTHPYRKWSGSSSTLARSEMFTGPSGVVDSTSAANLDKAELAALDLRFLNATLGAAWPWEHSGKELPPAIHCNDMGDAW